MDVDQDTPPADAERPASQLTIAQLVSRIAEDASSLIRGEVELAKREMATKGKRFAAGGGMFAAAALLGLTAFACIVTAVILALSEAMPAWLAAAIVAVAAILLAALLALLGKRSINSAVPPVPEQTLASAKEDLEWLKHQATSTSAPTSNGGANGSDVTSRN